MGQGLDVAFLLFFLSFFFLPFSAVLDTTDKLQSCEARAFGSGKAAGWNNMLEGFCALVSCWARGYFFSHP